MTMPDLGGKPIADLLSLKGRAAVITGGARGIGLAIGKRFAEAGAAVLIADTDAHGCLEKAVKALEAYGGKAEGLVLDARSQEDMERAAKEAASRFGGLHIWVNNAGIYPSVPVLDITPEQWRDVVSTNIDGVFHGSRAAARRMKGAGGGVILNLASVAGLQGEEWLAHYSATKFAVRGLTASLAKEWGEANIRVVALAPTMIDTPGIRAQKPTLDEQMEGDSLEKTAEEIPLGRIGQPDDVARVALFAVSDLAGFVSGTTIVVDGGNLALG